MRRAILLITSAALALGPASAQPYYGQPAQQPATGQGGPWRDWWQQRPWQDGQVTRPEFQAWRDQRPQGQFGGQPPGQPPAPGVPGQQAGPWQHWWGQRPARVDAQYDRPELVAWRQQRPPGVMPRMAGVPSSGQRPPRSPPIPPALGGGMGGPQQGRRWPAALGNGGFGGRWGR